MEGKREKNNLSLSFIYKYLSNLTVMIMALFFPQARKLHNMSSDVFRK